MSQTRAGLSQGRGGIVNVILGESDSASVNAVPMRWPADPYGNPWVIYMLDLDVPTQQLSFVVDRAPNDGTVKGNFVNAVVSYGENLVPGGNDPALPPNGPANVNDVNAEGSFPWSLRLFTGSFKAGATVKLLNGPDFLSGAPLARERAAIWSQEFYGGTGISNTYIGIADEESDDVVFEF
jgi:hypothetical protein